MATVEGEPQLVSQAEAGYKPQSPVENCSDCDYFYGNSCELVEPPISPTGTCRFWYPSAQGEAAVQRNIPEDIVQ